MMSSERTLDLLDPPTLVKALKDAAHAKAASDADADAYTVATVRTALEAAEKSVALSIDKNMHANAPSLQWRHRVRLQIKLCLEWLENAADADGPWFFGDKMTQADITVAAALDHVGFRHERELDWDNHPKLKA